MAIIGVNKAIDRPVVAERRDHRAPHDEPVLVVRSPLRRRLRRRGDDPGAQGPARAPGDDLHPRLDMHTLESDRQPRTPQRHDHEPPGAPRLRHGAGRPDGDRDVQATAAGAPTRSARSAPIPMHPAAHVLHYASTLLRGLQGLSLGGRQRARVPHGQAHRAHAPEREPALAAGAGRGAARADDPADDRPHSRAGAGAAGRALPAAACCSAPCRTSARPRSRRTRPR